MRSRSPNTVVAHEWNARYPVNPLKYEDCVSSTAEVVSGVSMNRGSCIDKIFNSQIPYADQKTENHDEDLCNIEKASCKNMKPHQSNEKFSNFFDIFFWS